MRREEVKEQQGQNKEKNGQQKANKCRQEISKSTTSTVGNEGGKTRKSYRGHNRRRMDQRKGITMLQLLEELGKILRLHHQKR